MSDKPASYQQLSDELNDILAALQRDELDIDEALKLHARGLVVVEALETYLKTAENSVTKLQAKFKRT